MPQSRKKLALEFISNSFIIEFIVLLKYFGSHGPISSLTFLFLRSVFACVILLPFLLHSPHLCA